MPALAEPFAGQKVEWFERRAFTIDAVFVRGHTEDVTYNFKRGIIAAEKVFMGPSHPVAPVTVDRATMTDQHKSAVRNWDFVVDRVSIKAAQLSRIFRRRRIDKPSARKRQEVR